MNKLMINPPLTDKEIQEINSKSKNGYIIVFENTKDLRKEDLEKLDPNMTISIMGGLNIKKKKFNDEHYQKRTYYSPKELISIINFYEKIERQINPLWNELEKCMFVYKTICEYSNYDESSYNGRDAARNLLGLITGKSVCSGYALIFKEAMDRLNIKCYYQNMQGHHSWNIVELDGNLYAVELTWDTYNKQQDNKCHFIYFCRENKEKFYSNSHHCIKDEPEEYKYDVKECPVEVLRKALDRISSKRIKHIPTEVRNGLEACSYMGKTIIIKNNIPYLNGSDLNTFIRADGSGFLIIPTNKSNDYIKEYVYIIYDSKKKNEVRATRIYSEMDLLVNDRELRNNISNNLLAEDRITKKINGYNGYVGYVEKGSLFRYYNSNVEQSLNIHR